MAELATIARPYAEALFQSAKPAELATCLEQFHIKVLPLVDQAMCHGLLHQLHDAKFALHL